MAADESNGEDGDHFRRTSDDTALLLDVMLGSLARHLRMCGYDAAYALDRGIEDDDAILALARAEDRVVLTRDAQLAERAAASVRLRARDVTDQLRELHDAGFVLALEEPARCARCNGRLERVPPTESTPEYAPDAGGTRVWRCTECGQHYWTGSHWEDVADRLPGTDVGADGTGDSVPDEVTNGSANDRSDGTGR